MAKATDWLAALKKQDLEVRSARDATVVKGWLDTGNFALNWAVSGRLLYGYPLGHTVEIFGDPSTGKSLLAARALAMAQAAGGVGLLDDTEHAYTPETFERLGVDAARLAYRSSRTVKEHLKTAQAFVAAYRAVGKGVTGALVCDSLAQLSTEHEMETQLDKRDMSKAAELKAFFRIVAGDLADLPVVHISTNHTIAAIGSMFQSRTTPGGGGPKFAASVRIDLRAISKIKVGTEYGGAICRAFIDKNRIVAPWKEVRLAVPFSRPISRASGLLPLLLDLGVLKEHGQFVHLGKDRVGRSNKSKDKFIEQDEVGEELLAKFPDVLAETDAKLAAGQLTVARMVAEPIRVRPPGEAGGEENAGMGEEE